MCKRSNNPIDGSTGDSGIDGSTGDFGIDGSTTVSEKIPEKPFRITLPPETIPIPGCRLLPPTSMDGKVIVGLQARPLAWLAEGKDFLEA